MRRQHMTLNYTVVHADIFMLFRFDLPLENSVINTNMWQSIVRGGKSFIFGCRQLDLTGKDTRFNNHISLANINDYFMTKYGI